MRRIVVKLGTNVIMRPDGKVALGLLCGLVEQIAALRSRGIDVLVVSSGAIALGVERLGLTGRPKALEQMQACAAIGQSRLMALYDDAFDRLGCRIAQVLLTEDDFLDPVRHGNLRATLHSLLELGVIPIVNENDTVSTMELDRPLASNSRERRTRRTRRRTAVERNTVSPLRRQRQALRAAAHAYRRRSARAALRRRRSLRPQPSRARREGHSVGLDDRRAACSNSRTEATAAAAAACSRSSSPHASRSTQAKRWSSPTAARHLSSSASSPVSWSERASPLVETAEVRDERSECARDRRSSEARLTLARLARRSKAQSRTRSNGICARTVSI